jgi:hypothetical protein
VRIGGWHAQLRKQAGAVAGGPVETSELDADISWNVMAL